MRFLSSSYCVNNLCMNFAGLKYLSRCSRLVSLKLGLCTNISDKGLSYVASNCLKIRELDLYRYDIKILVTIFKGTSRGVIYLYIFNIDVQE